MWLWNKQPQHFPNSAGRTAYGGHWPATQALQGRAAEAAYLAYLGALTAALQSLAPASAGDSLSPISNAGIGAGEIRAWRCWRYHDGALFSMTRNDKWIPGVPMTGDVGFGRRDGLGFGVHTWKSRAGAAHYAGLYPDHCLIVGQVDLWGEIVEHDTGYRAQYAAIVSLDAISGAQWMRYARLTRARKMLRI